jgi:hypothetical protein
MMGARCLSRVALNEWRPTSPAVKKKYKKISAFFAKKSVWLMLLA